MFAAPTCLRLFTALVLTAGLSACGGGGGGSDAPPPGGGSVGTSTQAPQSFVNPAWNDPARVPATLWAPNAVPDSMLASWFWSNSWLLDRSMWVSYSRQGAQPAREKLGAYGIGNGRCFGMLGMSYPLNTLHGMMGPTYQIGSNGYFGDVAFGMELYPRAIAFSEEWVWKVRKAAVTVTKSRSNEIELYTVDFAPPGIDAL